jgi:hypothetical protein
VSGVVGGPTPTGTVTFEVSTDGGSSWTAFGAVKTLSGGSAISDSYTPFSAGAYYFRAVYSGDSNYLSSQSGPTDEPLTVSMTSGELGTYYVSYNSSSGQNSFLTNSPSLPPFSKVNPELNNGHPTVTITSSNPVPSIVTSNPIYITYAVQVKSGGQQSFQTIQIQLGFNYNGTYYSIGNASFDATAVNGSPPPAFYTVSISVPEQPFVPGFPVRAIPAGSQIVLTTTVVTQTNRINIYGGMGGTRIVFF